MGGWLGLCGLAAAAAMAVPGRYPRFDGGELLTWIYPASTGVWAAGLLVAAVLLMARPPWASTRAVAAVAVLLSAQLAGISFVAVRDWFNAAGAGGIRLSSLADVVTIAAGLCVVTAIATYAGAALLWRERVIRTPRWRPTRPRLAATGIAVAVLLPAITGAISGSMTITSLGVYALTWSLPWGGALLAAAYLDRQTASTLSIAAVTCGMCAAGFAVIQAL